jgi:hypothetical protein
MRSLKISGLLVLMLATLAACSSSFNAAPSLAPGQTTAQQQNLDPDNASRNHGW